MNLDTLSVQCYKEVRGGKKRNTVQRSIASQAGEDRNKQGAGVDLAIASYLGLSCRVY